MALHMHPMSSMLRQITDEEGNTVAPGETGELRIRGDNVQHQRAPLAFTRRRS